MLQFSISSLLRSLQAFFEYYSCLFFFYFPLELIISQTPYQMKSLALSIGFVLLSLAYAIDYAILSLFTFLQVASSDPNCGLYYYVLLSILSVMSFFCYVYLAKKYKLRVRDDIVPIYRLAEEYFEKEDRLRRAYWKKKELANW